MGVVDEAVDERGGDHGVTEDLAPGLEAAVAGDDDRAALVAARDQGEEQVRGLALQWQVADLVDDEQAVALQAPQLGVECVAVLGLLEPVARRLEESGAKLTWDDQLPGIRRFYTEDPWGNRIELLA